MTTKPFTATEILARLRARKAICGVAWIDVGVAETTIRHADFLGKVAEQLLSNVARTVSSRLGLQATFASVALDARAAATQHRLAADLLETLARRIDEERDFRESLLEHDRNTKANRCRKTVAA